MTEQARTSERAQAHPMVGCAGRKEGSMKREGRMWNVGIVSAVAGMAVALALIWSTTATAQFTQKELFFELNDTDGDLGLHAAIDGEPWVTLEIEGPDEQTLLVVTAQGKLARQGGTQLMLESAEPSFDELTPAQFFRRFPEGWYELELTNQDGAEFETRVRLSHVLAAPPDGITVQAMGGAAVDSTDCDDPAPPSVPANKAVLVDWDPVEMSHPEIGKMPPRPVNIVRYQFFVEQGSFKLGVDLPPHVTQFQIPLAVMNLLASGPVKFEIIARTTALNNTAVEQCFMKQ